MKNSKLTWLIAGITAILIIAILVPRIIVSTQNDIGDTLGCIKDSVEKQDWQQASGYTSILERQWRGQKYFLALNYAGQDYSDFDDALCRVKSAVLVEDTAMAVSECTVAQELLRNIYRLIPEP